MFKGAKYPLIERKTPVIDLLKERPTLILDQPLVTKLNPFPFGGQIALPPGVTKEEAVEVVRETWGKKLAAGMADRAGLTGKEREAFIESWSRVVSEGLLKGA